MDTKRIRKFVVAVLVIMFLVAGATQGNPALSQPIGASSVQNGRIAFVSDRDGSQEIYVMNSDGSGITRLTNNGSVWWDRYPAWSPDGSKIAWEFGGGIFVMNADGSEVISLILPGHDSDWGLAWSPDGSKIAFSSVWGSSFEICVMNADGTGVTRLTSDPSWTWNWYPTWSPDGSKIAFVSRRDGNNNEIFVMNADGTGQTNLSNNQAEWDIHPTWSPDGSKIAFSSDRDGNPEIYIMNTDGSGVTRLTNNQGKDEYPAWSPDGSKIAFTSNRIGNNGIYVMNFDGSGVTRLTNSPYEGGDWDPDWGPGGVSPTPRAWTLMFYMAGDNDTEMERILSWELGALKEASRNPNVHVVIFWDGISSEASYRVFSGGAEVERVLLGELSTGSPDTLVNFIKWAHKEYPGQHSALIIVDHGQGLGGAAYDNHPNQGDWLTPKELRQALDGAGKVDVIYMSACLMANLESAYQLRGYADYYVANESQSWGANPQPMVAGISDSTTAEQLALSMAETYFSETQEPTTISVVRLYEVENVAKKTSALAGALRRYLVDVGPTLWNLTDASLLQRFDDGNPANGIDNEDELVDLYRFAWLVESSFPEPDIKIAAQELMSALGSYVVGNWQRSGSVKVEGGKSYDWPHENAHGVSIACPRAMICFYSYSWLDFAAGTRWPLCPEVSALSAADSEETIEWGSLMVDLVTAFNPDAPAITDPPEPIPLLQNLTETYLPIVLRN